MEETWGIEGMGVTERMGSGGGMEEIEAVLETRVRELGEWRRLGDG